MGTARLMVTQRLYLPRSPVMAGMMAVQAQLGQGLEVLSARRGQAGYSPVCEVMTYDLGMPVPPDDVAQRRRRHHRQHAAVDEPPARNPPLRLLPAG